MADPIDRLSKWGKFLIFIGGGFGVVFALGLASLRVINSSEPFGSERALGDFAFGAVLMMPFALALWALRWKDVTMQAAAWLAGGALALLASFIAFSGVSLVFLLTVPVLILGALFTATNAFLAGGIRSVLPILPIAPVLAGIGVGSFIALLMLTPDPRCWVLERLGDGRTTWERDLTAEAAMVVARGPNGETVMGSDTIGGPPVNGVQRLQSSCTSDVISPIESAVSLGMWALAIVGLEVIKRYRGIGALVEVGG
jgi:hypothetical protein